MKRLIYILLAMLLVASGPALAKKRNSSAVKKEKQSAANQAQKTKQQLDANNKTLKLKLNELDAIAGEIAQLDGQIATLQSQIDILNDSVLMVTDTIQVLTDDVERIKASATLSLRESRSRRQTMTATSLVLSAKNFSQAMKRMSYMKQLDKSRLAKGRALNEALALLDLKREQLVLLRDKQTAAVASLSAQQKQLEAKQASMQTLVAELQRNGKALERELARRQKKVNDLDSELNKLIAEEQEAARIQAEKEAEAARIQAEKDAEALLLAQQAEAEKQNQKPAAQQPATQQPAASQPSAQQPASQPSAPKASTPSSYSSADLAQAFVSGKGSLPNPVAGKCNIVGRFGRTQHAALAKVEVENPGVDIETQSGANALAVSQGVVSSIFRLDGYHNIVMVRHGEYITVYANIDNLSVKKGDNVDRGQALGSIYADPDDNGRSVLHFEVRKEKEKLNPLDWIIAN